MDATSGAISFGPFRLDLLRGELVRAGELVSLAPKPLALLGYLAAHRDRAVPKQELRREVWPDVFVSEAALASALKDLRRALGDDGARQGVIRTLRRRGYRFVAKVGDAPSDRRAGGTGARPERRKRPPFVARGRELKSLIGWASQAVRGRPRVVIISGEAGAGKTRLLDELIAHPVCGELAIALGRCNAEGSLPYLPFAEAISARLIDADESPELVLGDEAAILRPLLQLDAPDTRPAEPIGPLNAQRDRADLFAAVWDLIASLSKRRATLLAIEDLHDADSASLDLFADVVGACSNAAGAGPLPLLIVATTRPPLPGERLEEILRRLESLPSCSRVRIGGLGVGATRQLLDGLGAERTTHSTLRQLRDATDGNPLYIRELVWQAGLLARDGDADGRYRATLRATQHDGLHAAIASRVARLSHGAREALTAAAFMGERFGLLTLGAVCHTDASETRERLLEAARAELVVGENRSFRFDHPLVREVISEQTPDSLRREIHRDVAAVFEDLYATSPGEHAMEIAHHLVRAGDLVEAPRLLEYARRAGDQASSVCAWQQAAHFYEAALGASPDLFVAERAALHLRAGLAANHDYDAEPCLRHYARAAEAFAEAGDDVGLGWSLMYLTRGRFTFPSASLGVRVDVRPLEELIVRFGETHPALRAQLLATISAAHWVAGDMAKAQQTAERAVEVGILYDDDVACHHAFMGLGLAQLSQLCAREALESWLESAARARRSRDLWLQATPGPRIALALLHLGRLEEARERGRAAVELARRAHNVGEVGFACAHLASIACVSGAFAESESYARASLSALDQSGYPWAGVFSLPARACTAAHRGAWGEASAALEELVTAGRVFEKPSPAIQFMVAAYQDVVTARSGAAEIDARRAAGMVEVIRGWRPDSYALGAVCALAEVGESLRDPALAATPEAILRLAVDRGIVFTAGWVYLIPRIIARCAALNGRGDEAESWLERAIGLARAAGARAELGQSLVDRAGVRLRSGDVRGASRDLDEAQPVLEELSMQPGLRAALRLRSALAGAK
ncbi:MAG: ATP-binding protein [Myxococcota bacterium]